MGSSNMFLFLQFRWKNPQKFDLRNSRCRKRSSESTWSDQDKIQLLLKCAGLVAHRAFFPSSFYDAHKDTGNSRGKDTTYEAKTNLNPERFSILCEIYGIELRQLILNMHCLLKYEVVIFEG